MSGEFLKNITTTKILGEGNTCFVKLAQCKNSEEQYALKIFKRSGQNSIERSSEIFALSNLHHENIIKLIDFNEKSILFEYMKNGELFEFVAKKKIPEEISKVLFQKIASTLKYIHDNKFVHRDIKLENILLDENFNIKIADFGFSAKVNQPEALFDRYMGTAGYMAPEIESRKPYNGYKVDVFACGVLLFCMVIGIPPFFKATENDPYYKYFFQNKENEYWEFVQKKYKFEVSEEFRDLINKMIQQNPEYRISIDQVLEHPWFANVSDEQVAKEFFKNLI